MSGCESKRRGDEIAEMATGDEGSTAAASVLPCRMPLLVPSRISALARSR